MPLDVVLAVFGLDDEFIEAGRNGSLDADDFAVERLRVFEDVADGGVDGLRREREMAKQKRAMKAGADCELQSQPA